MKRKTRDKAGGKASLVWKTLTLGMCSLTVKRISSVLFSVSFIVETYEVWGFDLNGSQVKKGQIHIQNSWDQLDCVLRWRCTSSSPEPQFT